MASARDIYIPSIDLPPDGAIRTFKGPIAKFILRDELTEKKSATHEKQIVTFSGEYGDQNAEFYCAFKQQMDDVLLRKPCDSGGAEFGVWSTCLRGKALKLFTQAQTETLCGLLMTSDLFVIAQETFKSNFLTPRHPTTTKSNG